MHTRPFKPWLSLGLLALAACLCTGVQAAAPITSNKISASNAWIRWLPGVLPLAGYVTLRNRGTKARELVGASSPAFKRIELHRSMDMHDMNTMVPIASVKLPAQGEFRFAPGGYHMMMWRARPLKVGDKVAVTLKFADGDKLRVMFTVKSATQ